MTDRLINDTYPLGRGKFTQFADMAAARTAGWYDPEMEWDTQKGTFSIEGPTTIGTVGSQKFLRLTGDTASNVNKYLSIRIPMPQFKMTPVVGVPGTYQNEVITLTGYTRRPDHVGTCAVMILCDDAYSVVAVHSDVNSIGHVTNVNQEKIVLNFI